jgi:hypothetical protein
MTRKNFYYVKSNTSEKNLDQGRATYGAVGRVSPAHFGFLSRLRKVSDEIVTYGYGSCATVTSE